MSDLKLWAFEIPESQDVIGTYWRNKLKTFNFRMSGDGNCRIPISAFRSLLSMYVYYYLYLPMYFQVTNYRCLMPVRLCTLNNALTQKRQLNIRNTAVAVLYACASLKSLTIESKNA